MVYSRAWWQPTSSSSAARFTGCASVSSAGGASSAVPVEDSVTSENTSFWVGFKQTQGNLHRKKKCILRMESRPQGKSIYMENQRQQNCKLGGTVAQLKNNIPSPFSCFSSAGSSTFSLWSAPFWTMRGENVSPITQGYYFRNVNRLEKTFPNISNPRDFSPQTSSTRDHKKKQKKTSCL